MAANDIYRSYQVIVEETIDPNHQEGRSAKASRFDPRVAAALHTTNELYQDALCYYVLLLAGLAKNHGLNPLWERLTSSGEVPATGDIIRRLANRYTRFHGLAGADELVRRFYPADISEAQLKEAYEIVEQQGIKQDGERSCADMSAFASSWASILCDPQGGTVIPGNGIYDALHRRLREAPDEQVERELMAALEQTTAARAVRQQTAFDEALADALEQRKPKQTEAMVTNRLQKEVLKKAEDQRQRTRQAFLKAFEGEKTGKYRTLSVETIIAATTAIRSASLDDPRFRRLRYGERDNSFEQPFFRFLWMREDPAARQTVLSDLREYLQKEQPEPAPMLRGRPVAKMPYQPESKTLFPFFTTCIGLRGREAWEFDKAAFAEAAEDVFKYKLRTAERDERRRDVQAKLAAFEAEGIFSDEQLRDGSTRRTYKIRGMRSDPRGRKMEELLAELAQGLGGYTLRPATIGGWADLRKALLRTAKQKHDNLADALVGAGREGAGGKRGRVRQRAFLPQVVRGALLGPMAGGLA